MPSTTEIATLTLVAGSDIGDPNNPAAQVFKDSMDTINKADGLQQAQFGLGVESPDMLQLFQNWDSKKDHENFQASDAYTPFVNRFKSILTGDIDIVHVDFQPEGGLKAALSAPVTEVATFSFDGGPPDNAHEGVAKCLENLQKDGGAVILGWAWGTTHETVEKDGVKGKAGVLAIGWETKEAHMAARETQAFKDNIHLLRNGAKGIEMHHTRFMNFLGGGA